MSKLTDWEVGQELIKAQDTLMEIQVELRANGHKEFADLLWNCGLKIGTAFNKLGSHEFGLRDETNCNPVTPARIINAEDKKK